MTEGVAVVDSALLWISREVAARVRVCERTVWEATKRGELRSVRIGRRVLYDPKDVKAWIASRKVGKGE